MKNEKNWPGTRLDSLTGNQVKALLMVAAESRLASASLAEHAAELDRMLAHMSGTQGDALVEPLAAAAHAGTPVEELTRLKDLAKTLMNEDLDDPRREAARLLYHLSVAAAFVHHGTAISGRPMHKQQAMYEKLAETWAGHPIGAVFHEAVARARHA